MNRRFAPTSLCILLLLCTCRTPTQPEGAPAATPYLGPPRLLAAPNLSDATPLKLGQVSKRALPLVSGDNIACGKGHLVSFALATTGPAPVTVSIEGASLAPITLEPGFWKDVQLLSQADKLVLRFNGGPVLFSQPHYFNPQGDKAPNLLLISIDTLRKDYFTQTHMPRTFAALAKGTRFERAYSPTPWTLPAHLSMLTGLYPAFHGVRTPDQKLGETTRTLADHLREIGYLNAAFTEGNYVSASFGFDQGFHHFYENPPTMLETDPQKISKLEGTIAALRAYKAESVGPPRFLFLHTYEAHCPYVPRGGVLDPDGLGNTQWLLDHDGKTLTDAQKAKLTELYAAEVAYVDQHIGALVEEFLNEGWLVALTSDHGEEFGEHGGLLHAHTVYEEVTAIPLAIAGPGIQPGQNPQLASLVDLVPTLLALMNLPSLDGAQGRDLFATPDPTRAIFSESFFFGVHLPSKDPMVAGVWKDQYKLIQSRNFDLNEVSLFDLAADPGEQHNLQQEKVRERNAHFGQLRTYLTLSPKSTEKVDNLTQEQIDTMKSLGYIK